MKRSSGSCQLTASGLPTNQGLLSQTPTSDVWVFQFSRKTEMMARKFSDGHIKTERLEVYMGRSLRLALFPALVLCAASVAQHDSGR